MFIFVRLAEFLFTVFYLQLHAADYGVSPELVKYSVSGPGHPPHNSC